ncbi:hypothetical protein LTR56_000862 [Elasticomyces elasticus]|nr:hypothetical protein LTR22_018611 [Elasticomyces elasticus]KAK3660486.1 hypothetical protein LTR56_000862 [Elasticomyces elasticus]KAK4912287.1 hypothetical protein LTR49_019288 [Elasticomyces elasticus]KAK5751778.1 hypothetical protein LTS12_018106 [Elasticomyces elasticus]
MLRLIRPTTRKLPARLIHTSTSLAAQEPPQPAKDPLKARAETKVEEHEKPKKTQAQLDAELMEKLAGMSDEGGSAGVEYEDGKPVTMKRSVKSNMFRYI